MKDFTPVKLYTTEGEALSGTPWNVYPRPQLVRKDWLCLNGEWSFCFEGDDPVTILVPFCPESLLSGYEGRVEYGSRMIYEKVFTIPSSWAGKRIILNFGAVSRSCEVLVNGSPAASNDNGYLPFSADITDLLLYGENKLTVRAFNDLSTQYPYGKQKKARGGMWYTPVSGIWQTVWLEPVPDKYITCLKIDSDLKGADIEIHGVSEGTVYFEGREQPFSGGRIRLVPEAPHLWSPDDPYLYKITVTSGKDEIESYFALRTITSETVNGKPRMCLNGKPFFFNGLLDQGYFSDGLYSPASPALFAEDIRKLKKLGFNTLRKHIKIEPLNFYYECDRLGMIVFQDMVNNGIYSFRRDTLRPTIGLKRINDAHTNTDPKSREIFLKSMERTAKHLYNCPSILLWTIFNEGWGQFRADEAYEKLKSLDPSRLIDSTSGWFHQKKTDVDSLHIYFGKLKLGKRRDLPQFLSEFGGYVYKINDHSFNPVKTYGYKLFKSKEEYIKAFRKVYLEDLVPLAEQGLCGSIYTQVSDVEDETNGIFTYDRKVCRLSPSDTDGIAGALAQAVKG
ncbi:MAG: glycoside hydrolase family 2 [Clostridia bacterium]|nr:glycoside hydrolase family 2 [Clostridia bacterium]